MSVRFFNSYRNRIIERLAKLIKLVKLAKPSTRKYCTSRNINAFKELSAKMSDLDDFLAGVLLGVSYVVDMMGRSIVGSKDNLLFYRKKLPIYLSILAASYNRPSAEAFGSIF